MDDSKHIIRIKQRNMGGLARLCKLYGSMEMKDQYGNTVKWVYDYANDKPRLESEMTDEEIKASEKAKWMDIKGKIG